MSNLGAFNLTKPTGPKHTATVLFFHGSGSNGHDMKEWVRLMMPNFSFPHIKILYPTAPLQPYTPAGLQYSNVWFDRADISINALEKLESIANIEIIIKDLIKKEKDAGIPSERIMVGGFSMGGALALHTAYRWNRKLAGVFAMSSFLNDNSIVYNELQNAGNIKLPPLLQIHGDIDELVPLKWGETTHKELKALGVEGEFVTLERLGHSINKRGINLLKERISKLLPEMWLNF